MLRPGLQITALALLALTLAPAAHAAQPSSPEAPAMSVAETRAPGDALFSPAPIGTANNPFDGCDGTFETMTTIDDSEQACRDYCASNGWEFQHLLYLSRGFWSCICCNTGG